MKEDLEYIYTPLAVAKDEVWKRRSDEDLMRRVREFLKDDVPDELKQTPRAVLSRHVVSPNFELLHFLDLAKEVALDPLGLEYVHDKFVPKNDDKYYLAKLIFYEGLGKKGGVKTSSLKVVDFDQYDGKKFLDMKTLSGHDFVGFHRTLRQSWIPDESVIDMSAYYRRNGLMASRYYTYILSLFVCYGVLFESFLVSDVYSDLTKDVFLPSFKEIEERFGVKPLIVRLAPVESEEDTYWRYYPADIRVKVDSVINRKNI